MVPAKKLLDLDGIETLEDGQDVTYVHFLCDRHELVWSEGAVTETLHTGQEALKTLSAEARAEIFEIFPELDGEGNNSHRPLARPVPKGRLIRKLVERIGRNGRDLVEQAA